MYKLFAWSHCNLFLHVYKIGIPGRDCEKTSKAKTGVNNITLVINYIQFSQTQGEV